MTSNKSNVMSTGDNLSSNDKVVVMRRPNPSTKSQSNKSSDEVFSFQLFLQLVIVYLIVLVILSLILQVSWNVSMPQTFGLPPLDFVNSVGLLFVSGLLLKR